MNKGSSEHGEVRVRDDGPILAWESAQTVQRKRAALALGGLALAALLIVTVMLIVLRPGHGKQAADPGTRGIGVRTPASSTATLPSSHPRSRSTAPSSTPTPLHAVLRCSGTPACMLPGDPGNAIKAVNSYRVRHGRAPVRASVSRAAQVCAVHSGDGASCPQSYFWEPVSGHDGASVVAKIAAKGTGGQFLLDPRVRAVQIGWAYLPSSGGYECVVVNLY